ncbi:MAG: hypothetical protein H7Z74_02015 [Anaerolineae bacterium]|nr:hypothetical protein [Gemmatimonadaceae bacterium]
MRHPAVISAVLLLASVSPLAGQATTVDEGRFLITRAGQRIGTEDFTIRRMGGPDRNSFMAKANVVYADVHLSPALRAGQDGSPLAYQIEVKAGTELRERLSGQLGRGRFSARVRTPRGESAKEYIVSDGALVLDDEIFHQYYFLARAELGTVPVVIPRRNTQVAMRVESQGNESISIGGTGVDARHLVISEPGGARRHVWIDDSGRVLKVMLEETGITAIRDELPR